MVGDSVIERIRLGYFNTSYNKIASIEKQKKIEEERWIIEKRRGGFIPALTPSFFDENDEARSKMELLKIGGIGSMPKSNLYYCNEGYGLITYRSDRFGLRNSDSKWDKPISSLFIGDSFTQGACVNESSVLSNIYENKVGKNSLNLGQGGNNPKHYATLSKLFIPKFTPKEVFMIFYPNDKGSFNSKIYDIHVKQNNPFFTLDHHTISAPLSAYGALQNYANFEIYGKPPGELQPPNPSIFQRFNLFFSKRIELPAIRSLMADSIQFKSNPDLLGDSRIAIDITSELCIKFGCKLRIIYIPNSKFWKPDSLAHTYLSQLKLYSSLKNLEFFDSSLTLNTEEGSTDYAIQGPHLSPTGYAKVINMLLSQIR